MSYVMGILVALVAAAAITFVAYSILNPLSAWWDRYLTKWSRWMQLEFEAMHQEMPRNRARKILSYSVLVMSVLGFLVNFSVLFAIVFAGLGLVVPRWVISWLRARRFRQINAQLGEALTLVSSSLRSGLSLPQGVELVVQEMEPPIAEEFAIVIKENRLGLAFDEALTNLAERVPTPDLDNRTLFVIPLALTGALLFAAAFALGGWLPSGTRSMILSLVMVGLVGLQLPQAYSTAERLSRNDGGLAGPAWQASCVLNALSELPSGLPLISNETAAVLLYRGVYPHGIPELETRTHLPLETQFGSGASDVEQLFRARQAALVLFDTVIWKLDAMYFGDADARLRGMTTGLEVFEDCQDGTIYLYPLE